MRIIIGSPVLAVPRPWLYFHVEAVIVNAYEVLTKNIHLRHRCKTLHEVLQCDMGIELWLDSGGYQFLRHNIEPRIEKIAEVYNTFQDVKYYLSLDYPPSPLDDYDTARRKLERSFENFVKLRKLLDPEISDRLIPVLHYCRYRDLLFSFLHRYLDHEVPVLAVGALVPYILILRGVKGNSRREALIFLAQLRDILRDSGTKLHVLGLGSPVIVPILEIMGVDSTDSSTWRIKAAYGKVVLPGGGEVHVTSRNVNFGRRKATSGDIDLLYRFLRAKSFPLIDRFSEIYSNFEYRALVNCFVILHSRELPRSRTFLRLFNEISSIVNSGINVYQSGMMRLVRSER